MHRIVLLLIAACLGLRAWGIDEDLQAASRAGDLAAVQALVAKGAAIEAKTPYGQTPLYLAAMNGREEVVRFLLEKGAAPDVHDTFYKASLLDLVLQRKHYGVAKMLIRKAPANRDEVLASVAATGDAGLVETLLEAGKPSQEALDKTYEAALGRRQTDIAALLKKAGAHEPAPAFAVDRKTLESYAGAYRSERIPLRYQGVREGRQPLHAGHRPTRVCALRATSATRFEFTQGQVVVEFLPDSTFTLKQGGATFIFKKAVTKTGDGTVTAIPTPASRTMVIPPRAARRATESREPPDGW